MNLKHLIRLAVLLVATAWVGYAIGRYRSHELSACQQRNAQLIKDLKTAVARGIYMESNLIICKESEKKCSK